MNALEQQFAQTVKEHKSTIYTVCYMFSQDADEVNDLFQEVLVNLWKGFESLTSGRGYIVWRSTPVSLSTERSGAQQKYGSRWTSTSLKIATRTPSRWTCSTSESPSCSLSTVRLSCSGSRTSLTRRSDRSSESPLRMSASVCLESVNS